MPDADEPPEELDSLDEVEPPEEEEDSDEDWDSDEEGEDEEDEEEDAAGEEEEEDLAGAFVEEEEEEVRPLSSSKDRVPSSLKEDSQAGDTSRASAMNAAAAWPGRMRGIGIFGSTFRVGW